MYIYIYIHMINIHIRIYIYIYIYLIYICINMCICPKGLLLRRSPKPDHFLSLLFMSAVRGALQPEQVPAAGALPLGGIPGAIGAFARRRRAGGGVVGCEGGGGG